MKHYYVTATPVVSADNLIKVDGVVLGKRVTEGNVTYIEIKDDDRLRSMLRGTSFVRIPLSEITNLNNGT